MIGRVSFIDVPAVVTSSIITILSPSLIGLPRRIPLSPWSFISLRLEQYPISAPYLSLSAIAVVTESGIPLYAGPNRISKSVPYLLLIASA